MTQLAIIGHRGYIGSYLHEQLLDDGSMSVFGYDHKNGIENKGANVDVSTHDVVIYLAGISGRNGCNNQPATKTFHENVYDIMTVASKMKPGALLIYASTASLYEGYGTNLPDEKSFLNVQLYDEYTQSMYLREQNVKTLTHIHTIGLRLGTVIGLSPVQRRDLVHFGLLRNAVLTGTARVFGANQSRAILWNRDLLNVIKQMIIKRDTLSGHRVYNVSSFNCSVAKIANELASMTGCNTFFEGDDDPMRYNIGFSMNTSKLEKDLGIQWQASNNRIIFQDLMTNLKKICWSPEYLKKCETIVCRVCKGGNMNVIYNFGNQPNANHYLTTPDAVLPEYPLQLCLCLDCWHTQIPYTIPPEQMFSNYVYLCGTSNTMRKYFADFAVKSINEIGVSHGTVLEIACNDGTLLDAYKTHGWKTYGYDPAKNLWELSSAKGHDVTVGFWGVDAVPQYPELDMIVAQNVCAHVPDPVAFLSKCREVMSSKTVLYIQTSQSEMIEYGQFDTAYHEHMSFFTVHSMMRATEMAGLKIENVEKVDVHGVSYLFKIRLDSDVDIRDHPIYKYEKEIGLYDELMYYVYVEKIKGLKTWMRKQVEKYEEEGVIIVGYGAAAKGMTILNYIGEIPMLYIADDSKNKQGYYATNNGYLITSPETLGQTDKPLCVMVFAWNFIKEIMEKTRRIREGKETYFVVPYPKKAVYHMNKEGEVHIVYEEIDTRYNKDSVYHETILISHFYNEELLLTQWIRHHASMFNCAVLINHKSNDASMEIIRREAPSTWNVVNTWLPDFCAVNTDNEVAGYENSFDNKHWRLALTTTEFLFTLGFRRKQNPVFAELDGLDAIQISSVSLIDHTQAIGVNPTMALLRQKHSYYFKLDTSAETEEERYLNNHYKRFMHRIRNMSNPYWLGRHNFKYSAMPKNLYILKFLYSPYPEFFSRKLQIRGKMAESNIREKWGFQHMMEFDDMINKYEALKEKPNASVCDLNDQMCFFDRYMKCIRGWEKDQLLCGIWDNLYDK
jgi:nucleoside-diphosphate-sugar epimerase